MGRICTPRVLVFVIQFESPEMHLEWKGKLYCLACPSHTGEVDVTLSFSRSLRTFRNLIICTNLGKAYLVDVVSGP